MRAVLAWAFTIAVLVMSGCASDSSTSPVDPPPAGTPAFREEWTGLSLPEDIALGHDGKRYVFDGREATVWVFGDGGVVLDRWILPGYSRSHYCGGGFVAPRRSESGSDTLFITDPCGDRIVKCLDDGTLVGQWGKSGEHPGEFQSPTSIECDDAGHIYVLDRGNRRIQKFDADGSWLVSIPSGTGAPSLEDPIDISLAPGGLLYVLDRDARRVHVFTTRGQFVSSWQPYRLNSPFLIDPRRLKVDDWGNVYFADRYRCRIVKSTLDGELLGAWGGCGAAAGEFDFPQGIDVDWDGTVFVIDAFNDRVQVFTYDQSF